MGGRGLGEAILPIFEVSFRFANEDNRLLRALTD